MVWRKISYDRKQSFVFSFPDLIQSSNVDIKVAVVARSFDPSFFKIDINSSFLANLNVPVTSSAYAQEYAKEAYITTQYTANSSVLNLDLEYFSSDVGAEAWLNYIQINTRRKLSVSDDYLIFRDIESLGNEIGEYKIENALNYQVWDVTTPTNVTKLKTASSGNSLLFNDSLNILREYIVFNPLLILRLY